MMKAKELREKKPQELIKEMRELQREIFNLRMQRGVQQAIKPDAFRKARRNIARIKTILNEKAQHE